MWWGIYNSAGFINWLLMNVHTIGETGIKFSSYLDLSLNKLMPHHIVAISLTAPSGMMSVTPNRLQWCTKPVVVTSKTVQLSKMAVYKTITKLKDIKIIRSFTYLWG